MIFEGIVVEGNRIGRTIGFPTANIATETPGDLPSGVFACRVWMASEAQASEAQASAPARVSRPAGKAFCGMLNIGTRPTVSTATPRTIEVHILDFSGNLYGRRLRVEILEKIRDEIKFPDLKALQARLEEDKTAVQIACRPAQERG